MDKIEFDVIIFHNCCPDGIMGLWTAYNYNKDTNKSFGSVHNKLSILVKSF